MQSAETRRGWLLFLLAAVACYLLCRHYPACLLP